MGPKKKKKPQEVSVRSKEETCVAFFGVSSFMGIGIMNRVE